MITMAIMAALETSSIILSLHEVGWNPNAFFVDVTKYKAMLLPSYTLFPHTAT